MTRSPSADDTLATAEHNRQLAAVGSACHQIMGGDYVDITEIRSTADSLTARVHFAHGETLIAKAWFALGCGRAVRETWVYEHHQHLLSVSTPELRGAGELSATGGSALFLEDVGDLTLGRAIGSGQQRPETAIEVLGQVISALHATSRASHPVIPAGPLMTCELTEEVERQLAALSDADVEELCRRLRKYYEVVCAGLGADRHAVRLCHGDIHAENIVLGRRSGGRYRTYLVDFESAVYAYPEYDIAKCIVTNSIFASSDQRRLARSYAPAVSVDDDLVNVWTVFHAVEGWFHGGLREGRDRSLWDARLQWVLARYVDAA